MVGAVKKIAPTSGPDLSLVHSEELSGTEQANLGEYINWADGIKSSHGAMVSAIEEYGAIGIGRSGGDPEDGMIALIDRKTGFRRIHGVMMAIGQAHARTLTRAFLIDRKPQCMDQVFGRLSGVVLGLTDDLEALADACGRIAMGGASKADKQTVADLRVSSRRQYVAASKAYAVLIREVAPARVEPFGETSRTSPPHVCRIGNALHHCPCTARDTDVVNRGSTWVVPPISGASDITGSVFGVS